MDAFDARTDPLLVVFGKVVPKEAVADAMKGLVRSEMVADGRGVQGVEDVASE